MEIVGMHKEVLRIRPGGSAYDETVDIKDPEEIAKAIANREDNIYFDKWGNPWSIDEVI